MGDLQPHGLIFWGDRMSGQIFLESAEVSVSETSGTILVAVVRTGDLSQSVTISYGITPDSAEEGIDYLDSSGTITMEAGVSRVLVPIDILDDVLGESTETFVLSLQNVDSGTLLAPRTVQIDILDNENPITDPPQPGLISTHEVIESEIITGLDLPIAALFSEVNPNLLYIAEKGGVIRTLNVETGESGVFMDISSQVNNNSDRGILNIVLHPDFEENPYFYVFYVADPPDGTGAAGPDLPNNRYAYVSRFEADASNGYMTVVENSEVILVGGAGQSASDISGDGRLRFDRIENINETGSDYNAETGEAVQDYIKVDSTSHAGGGLAFGPDGALYISIGDGVAFNFVDPRAVSVQDINSLSGKVLRIDPITGDGFADNPFATDDLSENASLVYQLGLRNPFRLAFDENGQILISDTGWNSYEEINSGGPGANFGWPFYEGGDSGTIIQTQQYDLLPEAAAFYESVANGDIVITPAFRAFAHDSSAPGYQVQAITGASQVFTGTGYSADFANHYFFADFSGNEIYAVNVNDRRDITFLGGTDSPRGPVDFFQGPDGKLYYIDIVLGRVVRIDDIIEVGGATVIATPAREVLSGSAGNDTFIFVPGTSTTEFTDSINSWEPGDVIDLSAFGVTAEDIQTRLISGGQTLKLLLGSNPNDFQLKINLNGFSVEEVLASIIYESGEPLPNRAPTTVDDVASAILTTPIIVDALANDIDVDGNDITIETVGAASNGTVELLENGTLQYTANDGFVGVDTFEYTITDGELTQTGTVSVDVSDGSQPDGNVFNATENKEIIQGTEGADVYVFRPGTSTALFIDTIVGWQPGDSIDLRLLGLLEEDFGFRSVSGGGVLKIFEGFDLGDFQLRIKLNGYSIEDVLASIIYVSDESIENTAPMTVADTASTVATAPVIIDALSNDSDIDGDTIVITSVSLASNGTVELLENGTLQYTANDGFVGVDTFEYTITDGELTQTGTVSVTVTDDGEPENTAPMTVADTASTVATAPVIIDALSNDSDIDGDTIVITSVSLASNGTVELLENGTLQYTANDGFVGVDTFEYTITDGELTQTGTVSVTVTDDGEPENTAPMTVADTASTVATAPVIIDALSNDSDIDGDTIVITSVSLASNGTVELLENGTLQYTANDGFVGVDTFEYTITDGELTQTGTVSVTVTDDGEPENTAPMTVADTASTVATAPVIIDALSNDSDIDGDTIVITSVSLASNGTVELLENGTLQYTANDGFVGVDTFEYTITDGELTQTGTVSVTVTNDGEPVANVVVATAMKERLEGTDGADAFVFTPGTSTSSNIDTIVDWQPGDTIDLSALGITADDIDFRTVSGGSVVKIIQGFGPEDFQVRVNLNGATVEDIKAAIVYDNGTPIPNQTPMTVADTASTVATAPVIIDALSNDSDIDGDTIVITSVSLASNGTVELLENGTLQYTANDGFVGVDTFEYTITDGELTQTGTVSVTVTNDGEPVANVVVATAMKERLEGTDGADAFVFTPGTSTSSNIDTIVDWQPGDTIDLSALGITADDIDFRTVSGGSVVKIIQGFGPEDFQVRVNLNGATVEDIKAAIVYDNAQLPNEMSLISDRQPDLFRSQYPELTQVNETESHDFTHTFLSSFADTDGQFGEELAAEAVPQQLIESTVLIDAPNLLHHDDWFIG